MTKNMPLPPDPWHYPRTELVRKLIDLFERNLDGARALFAPRRRGKTTFLLRDFIPEASRCGFLVAYADLWLQQDHPDVAITKALLAAVDGLSLTTRSMKRLSTTSITQRLTGRSVTANLGAGATVSAGIAGSQSVEYRDLAEVLDDAFALFMRAGGGKAILVIDEFQHLSTRPEFAVLTAKLRSLLVQAQGSVKAIFTGSSQHGLELMLNHRDAPFLQYASREPFENLGDRFLNHLQTTFAELSGGRSLDFLELKRQYERRGRNPAYIVALVRYCLTEKVDPATADTYVYPTFVAGLGFAEKLKALRPVDLHALVLLLDPNSRPYAVETLERISQGLGEPISASTMQGALRKLASQKHQLAAHRGSGADWYFEDPTFADWLVELIHERNADFGDLIAAAVLHGIDTIADSRYDKMMKATLGTYRGPA